MPERPNFYVHCPTRRDRTTATTPFFHGTGLSSHTAKKAFSACKARAFGGFSERSVKDAREGGRKEGERAAACEILLCEDSQSQHVFQPEAELPNMLARLPTCKGTSSKPMIGFQVLTRVFAFFCNDRC